MKPYRCLEGPFQSDALLVPEHCLFDHVHNQSVCQSSEYWNRTGSTSCEKRNMKLQSYAMLLPCGVGIFSGVEFVCCPASQATGSGSSSTPRSLEFEAKDNLIDGSSRSNTVPKDDDSDEDNSRDNNNAANDDDDDDYYDDDYEEDDDDDEPAPSSTTTTTTTTTTTERPIDHYLSHFDSMKEHDSFKSAQKNLEEGHRDKVTKVTLLSWNST